MLPNRALIVCESPDEAHELLDFLESTKEAYWYEPDNPKMYHGSCAAFLDDKNKQLCYSIRDGEVGYCYTSWYHSTDEREYWENHDEPIWNYISVPKFIRFCGGSPSCDETTVSLEGLL